MAVGAFLVARMGSTRLPGKSMLKILGKPMIELFAERISHSKHIDKTIITTSDDPSDDALEELAKKIGIGCFRGSLNNVMERINGAAETYGCDTIVELLGDNPLVHSDLIDDVVQFYRKGKYDYAVNVTKEYSVSPSELKLFSVGIRVQVYSKGASGKWKDYSGYADNYTSYMFRNPRIFKIGYFEAKGKWAFMNKPDLRFAVNYRKDFDFIKHIFEQNYSNDKNFSLDKVYEQLSAEEKLRTLMGAK